jgi:hypothetical protein
MKNWYRKDRHNRDPETRRPSERYDREEYYRNSNPDHFSSQNEEGRWHFAGKFEDKSDPTYTYGSRERDMMNEYPTYPHNRQDFYRRHPDQRFGTQSAFGDDSSYYGTDGDYSSLRDRNYEQTYAGRGPKGWKRSDDSIKETICHALEQHPRIDASEIEVDVKDGIVTLRGNIHDRPTKRLAGDVIDWLPGVVDVHNNLTVDKTFFERAKQLFSGGTDSGAADTPSRRGKPERNPRH